MITWEEAQAKIRAVAQQRYGHDVNQTWLDGVTVMSSVLSSFGFHFESPDATDHNWIGASASPLSDGGCPGEGSPHLGKDYFGNPLCFYHWESDEQGIETMLSIIDETPLVRYFVGDGSVGNFAQSLYDANETDSGAVIRANVRRQFGSEDSLIDALILDFQDLERKTGRTTDWKVGGKPVGQIPVQGPVVKSGGGSGSDAGSGSGTTGLLVGGAIAAVAIGLLYAATKAKLRP